MQPVDSNLRIHTGIPRYRPFQGPALFQKGFRPFFLGAGVWGALAVLIWLAIVRGEISLPTSFVPIRWHAHEMLFGFAAAAVAGFMLTAIPNWTGRMPLQGVPLILLVSTWLLGRVAVATSALVGIIASAIVDLAFLAALLAIVLQEIIAGRNWRNLPMPIAVGLLLAANSLTHLDAAGWLPSGAVGERLGLATLILLISLVGGRIIPSFTRNWLIKQGALVVPAPFARFDVVTLLFVLGTLALWVASPQSALGGLALVGAGVLSFVRLTLANAAHPFGTNSLDPALGLWMVVHWPNLIRVCRDLPGDVSVHVWAPRSGGWRGGDDDLGSHDPSNSGSHRSFSNSRCRDNRDLHIDDASSCSARRRAVHSRFLSGFPHDFWSCMGLHVRTFRSLLWPDVAHRACRDGQNRPLMNGNNASDSMSGRPTSVVEYYWRGNGSLWKIFWIYGVVVSASALQHSLQWLIFIEMTMLHPQ